MPLACWRARVRTHSPIEMFHAERTAKQTQSLFPDVRATYNARMLARAACTLTPLAEMKTFRSTRQPAAERAGRHERRRTYLLYSINN